MASKRRMRRRRCVGKHVYATPREAARDAAAMSRVQRKKLSAYRCPHCGGIHVGHDPIRTEPAPAAGTRCR